MFDLRAAVVCLAALALAACGGGGSTAPTLTTTTSSCPGGAATYALFTDLMTQPPAGSSGVATTIGSITVPQMASVAGATLQLLQASGGPIIAGTFVVNGSSLTATIPKLQPNTTYSGFAVGVPCGPDFNFGTFTTGAT